MSHTYITATVPREFPGLADSPRVDLADLLGPATIRRIDTGEVVEGPEGSIPGGEPEWSAQDSVEARGEAEC